MSAIDDFGGLLGDSEPKLEESEFCREVRTTLAQQLVTDVDGELLADLSSICRDGLATFRAKGNAKTCEFRKLSQKREQFLAKIRSVIEELQDTVENTGRDILVDVDQKRLRVSVCKLLDDVERASVRLRALRSMAQTVRQQPYPGALSLWINDFLCVHHRQRWNQKQRDLIIAACLKACAVYPRKDPFVEILDRVAMHRSRGTRASADDEGRVVHRPARANKVTKVL